MQSPFRFYDLYYELKDKKVNKSINNGKRKERFPREPLSMFYVTKSIYPLIIKED